MCSSELWRMLLQHNVTGAPDSIGQRETAIMEQEGCLKGENLI